MTQELVAAIRRASRIYLASHVAPDGDALGSMLGLHWALVKLGKASIPACADSVPELYAFLPGSELVSREPPSEEELIISIDSSDQPRLGALFVPEAFRRAKVINIDHHITNEYFGDLNLVDAEAAATAQLVLRLVHALGIALDGRITTCLLTGLADDTQCFRTSSTTPESLRDGAELMAAGASLHEIAERVFNTRRASGLALWGEILRTLKVEDGIAWAWETGQMRQKLGASPEEGRHIVNLLAGVREAEVAIVFKERQGSLVEVSMRSSPRVDVSAVALLFGGGGHPRAAGCNIPGAPAKVEGAVLSQVRRFLAEPEGLKAKGG